MEKYKYSKEELAFIEKSCIPYAVYQFVDNRVVTLALSDGFLELGGFSDREEAIRLMDHDMYRDVHPDDATRLADAALNFATGKGDYNLVYRSLIRGEYHVIHAIAEHFYPKLDTRLAMVWYVDEGRYDPDGKDNSGEKATDPETEALTHSISDGIKQDNTTRKLHYDYFSGLPSMTYYFYLADAGRKKMTEEGKQTAFLYINLSGMKFFNKKYGFAEGDKLIKAFSGLLKQHFSTDNCSRLGQDHFAVYTELEGLEGRLGDFFKDCKNINDGKSLPVKVGIYPDAGDKAEISLACDRAKMACDSITTTTRSGYAFFDEKMLRRESNRLYILENLDKAIEEGWIKAFYQPIIRAANGRVCDEEALSRWIEPEKGMLSPGEFIPILEESKLIYKVDLYIVDQILKRMKDQAERGFHVVPISVNLSRTDFEVCDIVEEIKSRVDAAGINRDMLTIEITESVVGSDFDYMKEQIERFQSLGFKVWMDDFGSGYSSLDLLQDLHFDLIKLDMRFMRQFDNGDKSKIILTELVRMAISLGIETVTEGVETKEQAEFLREIGCTKLQGFHFCKPIPVEEIYERNKKGIQIGFENPEETGYYASIGAVNLYDLAVVSNDDSESFDKYFDTLPMAVVEVKERGINIIRCNQTFRSFSERYFPNLSIGEVFVVPKENEKGSSFLKAFKKCVDDGDRTFVDEKIGPEERVHGFIKQLAVNPVKQVTACAAVILGITNEDEGGLSFAHVANALSADYYSLYYVNLNTEKFIEYDPDAAGEDLSVERRGDDFFAQCRKDAAIYLYEKDRDDFINAYTKENIVSSLDAHGTFSLTYRLVMDGEPRYMNMKVVRMGKGSDHIVAAVTNVDAQMRQQELVDRIKEESATYERISALLGNLICMYSVDPETEEFTMYSAVTEYERLGLTTEGTDFFEKARQESIRSIFPGDLEFFDVTFTKENVLKEIRENGIFVMEYRLMLNEKPTYVCARAAMVNEKEGQRLVLGVTNQDKAARMISPGKKD